MDEKGEELTAMIAEIRERVRARYPNGAGPGRVTLADLMPLLHARDAADAKVAAIGTVNPRAPGLLNSLAQSVKRLAARATPKSVMRAMPSTPTNTFCGETSRCTRFTASPVSSRSS